MKEFENICFAGIGIRRDYPKKWRRFMPIDRKPIVDNLGGTDESKDGIKKKQNVDYFISEPKYSLDDVILPEEVKKEVKRIVSYLKYHDKIFNSDA